MLKKFMAALLAACLLLTTLPTAMLAGEGEGDGNGGETPAPITMTVTKVEASKDEVEQGESGLAVTIDFKIAITTTGQPITEGMTAKVDTNMAELFSAQWVSNLSKMEVEVNDQVYGTLQITGDEVIFVASDVIPDNTVEFNAQVKTPYALTARSDINKEGQTEIKTLQVGDETDDIIFEWKEDAPATPGYHPGCVDIDTFWKVAGNIWKNNVADMSGASIGMEVNPIGSMYLYASKMPAIHDPLFVKDTIPERGYIAKGSVKIYSAIPTLAIAEEDFKANYGWYEVKQGEYFALRQGTARDLIGGDYTGITNDRFTQLTQYDDETIDEFEARIKEKDLQWGIYQAKDKTQTFMCNFGRVGDPRENNGILYSQYTGQKDYTKTHPEIFGKEGPSGGNIVSYYIEFNTYYPDIVGKKEVTNVAQCLTGDHGTNVNERKAGYTIDNTAAGMGTARWNELMIKLVDEENGSTVIEGAEFTIQQYDEETGAWKDVTLGTTDANGMLTISPFVAGKYRIVQTSFADGYMTGSTEFKYSGNDNNHAVNAEGEFTVSGDESFGFATVVTNKKADEPVKVTFDKNDQSKPNVIKEVTLEKDSAVGEASWPTNPARDGYTFLGWNTAADGTGDKFTANTTVSEDITVYAQWKQVEFVTLAPENQTIYTGGDGGSGTNSEFPHPIYLLGGKVLDENTIFYVNGKPYEGYPFTVKYYDGDEEIKDDQRYGDYTARIVPVKGVNLSDITTADGKHIDFKEGTLRIRYVSSFTEASANALTSDAVLYTDESDQATARDKVEATDKAGVILPESSKIYLNGNKNYGYSADGPGQIALLFDELLPASAGGNSTDLVDDLIARAAAEGYDIQDSNTMFRYLDLVDTNDSNAWVSSSEGSDVFWPYPEGCDRNDDIQLLHFTDLHREYRMTGEAPLAEQIAASEVENVSIEKTANGIWFYVAESGFSPFVLVWDEKNDHPHWPPVGPGDDDDDPSEDPEEPDTPALDKVNHFLYVEGYPEDYRTGEYSDNEDLWPVKPQGNITRAEVATIFYRLLKDEVREEIETDVNSFPDVNEDDWFNVTVSSLANMGAISGYEDGTFRPNEPISRAELAAMAVRFYDTFEAEYEEGTFLDVDGDEWYADAIAAAEELGIIGGYPDGTVRPEANITRAETCAIVNRVLERRPHDEHLGDVDDMRTWPDNQPGAWYYADMQEATNGHYYEWIDIDGSKFEEWTEVDKDYDWTKR